jgi:hypothetical protein
VSNQRETVPETDYELAHYIRVFHLANAWFLVVSVASWILQQDVPKYFTVDVRLRCLEHQPLDKRHGRFRLGK